MVSRRLANLLTTPMALRRCFPETALAAIDEAITESERLHHAEIRCVIETSLPIGHLIRGVTVRERATEVFATLGVWDTAGNNGILLYVLLAERDIEVLADRGFNGRVSPEEWQSICVQMETAYRAGRYLAGTLEAVRRIGELAAAHFPAKADDRNELPDRPLLL